MALMFARIPLRKSGSTSARQRGSQVISSGGAARRAWQSRARGTPRSGSGRRPAIQVQQIGPVTWLSVGKAELDAAPIVAANALTGGGNVNTVFKGIVVIGSGSIVGSGAHVSIKPHAGEAWEYATGGGHMTTIRNTIDNRTMSQGHREAFAHDLDRALGVNMIPTTTLRDTPRGRGAVQMWAEGIRHNMMQARLCDQDDLFKITALDLLMGNTDRHGENMGFVNVARVGYPVVIKPVPLDHGLCMPGTARTGPYAFKEFRSVAFEHVEWRKITRQAKVDMLDRVSRLDVAGLVRRYPELSPHEITAFHRRVLLVRDALREDLAGNRPFVRAILEELHREGWSPYSRPPKTVGVPTR